MRHFAAFLAAAALGISAANAADIPVKAPLMLAQNWTGCYIGVNGGGAWSQDKFVATGTDEGRHTTNGFAAGGQIGCDYQFSSSWVVGFRGMWDWSNLKGNHAAANLIQPAIFTTNIRSFGTVTGRLGYAVNPSALIYAKTGVGWAKVNFDYFCGVACDDTSSGTRSGLDLGAGFEWMFMPRWSVFLEYDHVFLGNRDFPFTGTGVFTESIHQDFNMVLLGLNYRFGTTY